MVEVREPVACRNDGCTREWPRDPALEVECPECRAGIGHRCRRPSGYTLPGKTVHAARDLLADSLGLYGACPLGICGQKQQAATPPRQPDLFDT
jgi:hypothetical protein